MFDLLDFTGNGVFNSADILHIAAFIILFKVFYNTTVRR